jgi:all-trans-retinol dehydrogenase (NAD+)
MLTDFRGKNVLITGAASGIGRLMAEKIAAQQAHVVLWDLSEDDLQAVGQELGRRGQRCSTYVCDVSDREAVYATAARVLEDCGPLDVLINNAGIVSGSPLLEIPDEAIERTFRVNALALFWTTRAFLPAMIERRSGHIVTIASAAGLVGTTCLTDYCASKHAAVGFDDALRLELRHLGQDIRTTVVCPFYIATGMFEGVKSRVSWLLPILDPDSVTAKIVRAIRKQRRRVFLPPVIASIYFARLFPTWLFDALMRALGVTRSMDEFKGRSAHPVG